MKLAPSGFLFTQVQIGELPLYNQDDDVNPAETVKRLKSDIKAAHFVPAGATAQQAG